MHEPTKIWKSVVVCELVFLAASAITILAAWRLAEESQQLAGEMTLVTRGKPLGPGIRAAEGTIAVQSEGGPARRLSWNDTFGGVLYTATVGEDGIVRSTERRHVEYLLGWRLIVKSAWILGALSLVALLVTVGRARRAGVRTS